MQDAILRYAWVTPPVGRQTGLRISEHAVELQPAGMHLVHLLTGLFISLFVFFSSTRPFAHCAEYKQKKPSQTERLFAYQLVRITLQLSALREKPQLRVFPLLLWLLFLPRFPRLWEPLLLPLLFRV